MIIYSFTIDELKNVKDIKEALELIKNNSTPIITMRLLLEGEKQRVVIVIHVFASINQSLSNKMYLTYIENEQNEPLFVAYTPYSTMANLKEWQSVPIASLNLKKFEKIRDDFNSGKLVISEIY